MAEIYLARVPGVGIEGFEKLIVLKRILPQHALDPELLRMFLDEARLSATLTHPHVTEVSDVGESGDAPFFTMEHVHGANLRQIMLKVDATSQSLASSTRATVVLKGAPSPAAPPSESEEQPAAAEPARPTPPRAPLPLEHAIGIVAAAASGLHYAHTKLGPRGEPLNIVHRDVSPSNVLVSYDGAVKVSDFGIAKWAFQRTQTQEGALKGKFAYMSPEQCRGQPLDARSDVFALGTILYELTTGDAPFRATTDFEILNQIVAGPPRPPAWAAGEREYPAALAEIVLRAMARRPEDRYPTAQALQVDLEAFARAERLEVSTVALGAYMQTLFAEELAAWHEAQRAGKTLGDHLAEGGAGGPLAPDARTATDAFAATRPAVRLRRRWRTIALAAAVGLAAVGGVVAAGRTRITNPPSSSSSPSATAATSAPRATAGSTDRAELNNVDPHPALPPPLPPKPPARRAARPRATSGAPAAAVEKRSIESRLGEWDPDSPVPP
jgi:serine/threonine protein kinase